MCVLVCLSRPVYILCDVCMRVGMFISSMFVCVLVCLSHLCLCVGMFISSMFVCVLVCLSHPVFILFDAYL